MQGFRVQFSENPHKFKRTLGVAGSFVPRGPLMGFVRDGVASLTELQQRSYDLGPSWGSWEIASSSGPLG